MKIYYSIVLIFFLNLFSSCEIVQETEFNRNGSGTYSLGFDMSEMVKMGMNSQKNTMKKQIDTVIDFSQMLKEKKDSISKLSKEERKKLQNLENFSFAIKMDTISDRYEFKIDYSFKNIKDLQQFGQKLKDQDLKDLDFLGGKSGKSKQSEKMLDFNQDYITVFNKKHFSTKISQEAILENEKNRDTTLTKDSPMANMLRFKTVYKFPYKIKSVDNKNARISSDFKGVEIYGNAFDMNNNPHYNDLEIDFER